MSKGVDWSRYYEIMEEGILPGRNIILYERVVNFFSEGVFAREGLKVLVGGIAGGSSGESFQQLWEQIRVDKGDFLFFLDQNMRPLLEMSENLNRVAGRLQDLPLSPGSIDVFVHDFTFDFLNETELVTFLEKAESVLTQDGLIISLGENPGIFWLSNFAKSRKFGVPYHGRGFDYYRKKRNSGLELVYAAVNERSCLTDKIFCVIALAKKSAYQRFEGWPYSIDVL